MSTPNAPARQGPNAWLPAELLPWALPERSFDNVHQHIDVHGFAIYDSTMRFAAADEDGGKAEDLIWVSVCGEGRWLTGDEALQLGEALKLVAQAHIGRVAASRAEATPQAKGGTA